MSKRVEKRTVDMRIIGDWVEPHARVLDLGCGPGELLDYLAQTKQVAGVGVDLDLARISACLRRGVTAYQGDMTSFLKAFPARHFDRVICSRTVHELNRPAEVILEALRAGKSLTVGFINRGFWKNRVYALLRGRKLRSAVDKTEWQRAAPPIRSRSRTLRTSAGRRASASPAGCTSSATGRPLAPRCRICSRGMRCTISRGRGQVDDRNIGSYDPMLRSST